MACGRPGPTSCGQPPPAAAAASWCDRDPGASVFFASRSTTTHTRPWLVSLYSLRHEHDLMIQILCICMCSTKPCLNLGRKVLRCHIECYIGSRMGCSDLIKKLQNLLVNRETNLLSLINPSLTHVLLLHHIVKS